MRMSGGGVNLTTHIIFTSLVTPKFTKIVIHLMNCVNKLILTIFMKFKTKVFARC